MRLAAWVSRGYVGVRGEEGVDVVEDEQRGSFGGFEDALAFEQVLHGRDE